MTETMRVDIARLRDAGPAFQWVSTQLDTTLSRLGAVLDAAGDCWGTDEVGTAFAESYAPGAQLVREALPVLRDDVAGVGDAVAMVADGADAAEGRAQARMS